MIRYSRETNTFGVYDHERFWHKCQGWSPVPFASWERANGPACSDKLAGGLVKCSAWRYPHVSSDCKWQQFNDDIHSPLSESATFRAEAHNVFALVALQPFVTISPD